MQQSESILLIVGVSFSQLRLFYHPTFRPRRLSTSIQFEIFYYRQQSFKIAVFQNCSISDLQYFSVKYRSFPALEFTLVAKSSRFSKYLCRPKERNPKGYQFSRRISATLKVVSTNNRKID